MSPSRDDASSLPPSVEEAYRRKCIQLRARMREVEDANDAYRLRRERLARGIRKMRLERAILLETLTKRMNKKGPTVLEGSATAFDDPETDDSTDAPPTPQERPMRIKRPHRRPDQYGAEDTPGRGDGSVVGGGAGMLPGEGVLSDFAGRGEEGGMGGALDEEDRMGGAEAEAEAEAEEVEPERERMAERPIAPSVGETPGQQIRFASAGGREEERAGEPYGDDSMVQD